MTTYRGLEGFLSVGGVQVGTNIRLKAAVAQNVSLFGVTGTTTTLTGCVMVGDTFTIAGESGAPTHTVQLSTLSTAVSVVAFTNDAIATVLGMTPVAATGGVAEDAVITFGTTNLVGEVLLHSIDVEQALVDDAVMGEYWETPRKVGPAKWSGTGECYLDYDDGPQAELIDRLATATPSTAIEGILFGVATTASPLKFFYGSAILGGFSVSQPKDGLVTVSFSFRGSGAIQVQWDAAV